MATNKHSIESCRTRIRYAHDRRTVHDPVRVSFDILATLFPVRFRRVMHNSVYLRDLTRHRSTTRDSKDFVTMGVETTCDVRSFRFLLRVLCTAHKEFYVRSN